MVWLVLHSAVDDASAMVTTIPLKHCLCSTAFAPKSQVRPIEDQLGDPSPIPSPIHRKTPDLEEPLDALVARMPMAPEDQWTFLKFLGGGSYGDVYSVMWRGKKLALKVQSINPMKPFKNEWAFQEMGALQD